MNPTFDRIGRFRTRPLGPGAVLCAMLAICPRGPSHADGAQASNSIELREGLVEFGATTNIPALEVHGQGRPSRASALMRREGQRIVLQRLEARVPVDGLSTGMSIRDKHMRERVFLRPDGTAPDLAFVAEQAVCATTAPCAVVGLLTIRGEARPFKASLKIDAVDGDRELRVSGDGVVRLSDYGIAPPKQLGVSVADTINVQFRLVGRSAGIAAR